MSGVHKQKSKKILRSMRKPHQHDPAQTELRKHQHKVKSLRAMQGIAATRLKRDKDDINAWTTWKRVTSELAAIGEAQE